MNLKKSTGLLLMLGFGLGLNLLYFLLAREGVELIYEQKAPDYLRDWAYFLYPRLASEMHRFPLEFFLGKADQIMIRLDIILGFLLLIFLIPKNSVQLQPVPSSLRHSRVVIRIYAFLGLLFSWEWLLILLKLQSARFFYRPVFMLKIFALDFPSVELTFFLCISLYLSIALLFIRPRAGLLSASLSSLLFILLQGYLISFHKIDHSYASFIFIVIGIPFLVLEYQQATSLKKYSYASAALLFMRFGIGASYFFAGIEKLLSGGIAWFYPETLQNFIYLHQAPLGLFLADYPILCSLASVLAVVFELGFIAILFYPKRRFIFLISGILFHWGTYLLLDVGAWFSPWWLSYFVFLEKEDFVKLGFFSINPPKQIPDF